MKDIEVAVLNGFMANGCYGICSLQELVVNTGLDETVVLAALNAMREKCDAKKRPLVSYHHNGSPGGGRWAIGGGFSYSDYYLDRFPKRVVSAATA